MQSSLLSFFASFPIFRTTAVDTDAEVRPVSPPYELKTDELTAVAGAGPKGTWEASQ